MLQPRLGFSWLLILGFATTGNALIAMAETVDQFWEKNRVPEVAATTGYTFYRHVVVNWMEANNIRQQDRDFARQMEDYFLNPAKGHVLSEGYMQFIGILTEIESTASRHPQFRQSDVEKLIDVLIKTDFKDQVGKLQLPAPYATSTPGKD